ncbi:MAG: DEAD/DEAH box helicase [Nitrospirae bacterium]|nr:DEAD/DEAH box helicase [Nitrospirota bacterium]MBI3605246.1 DEAD/DEAH box helicase [Nitrospirota bacterium]
MNFEELSLSDGLRRKIKSLNFSQCTPIQEKTLPLTLQGKDVAGQAQTGTGKTAAFLIAIFQRLLETPPKQPSGPSAPRAFVVAPTRELAVQIDQDARALNPDDQFRIHTVFGGMDYEKQQKQFQEGVDLLIGTPGRLIDFFKQKCFHLKSVQILVVDEADRMFDMGFIPDLRYLLRKAPPYNERQTLLFSATLNFRVMELAYEHMNNPVKVVISPDQMTADKVQQVLYHVEKTKKIFLLQGLLEKKEMGRVLIFVNTKMAGEKLCNRLERRGKSVQAITGDIPQAKRLKILEEFKQGKVTILVATDVASRGLHIDGVSHVINYDVPQDPEDYVHRIGRTARAGAEGIAITLACEEYVLGLEAIEEFIHQKIPVEWAEEELFIDLPHTPYRHVKGKLPAPRKRSDFKERGRSSSRPRP